MSRLRSIVLISLTLMICTGSVMAQRPGPQFRRPLACEPLEPRTQLEALEAGYERVLVKGFTQIATMNLRGADLRIDAIDYQTPSGRESGIAIAMREDGERPRENRAFIDYKEIDPLISALDAIAKVNESVTKLAGFEAHYRTLGDLKVRVFRQGRSSGTAASVSSGICEPVTGLLTLDELDRLRAHVVEAKTRLDEIR